MKYSGYLPGIVIALNHLYLFQHVHYSGLAIFVLSENVFLEPDNTFLDLLLAQNHPVSRFNVGDNVDVFDADTGRFVMRGYVSDVLASGEIEVASEMNSYGYMVRDLSLRLIPFCTGSIYGPCDPASCRHATAEPPQFVS